MNEEEEPRIRSGLKRWARSSGLAIKEIGNTIAFRVDDSYFTVDLFPGCVLRMSGFNDKSYSDAAYDSLVDFAMLWNRENSVPRASVVCEENHSAPHLVCDTVRVGVAGIDEEALASLCNDDLSRMLDFTDMLSSAYSQQSEMEESLKGSQE